MWYVANSRVCTGAGGNRVCTGTGKQGVHRNRECAQEQGLKQVVHRNRDRLQGVRGSDVAWPHVRALRPLLTLAVVRL